MSTETTYADTPSRRAFDDGTVADGDARAESNPYRRTVDRTDDGSFDTTWPVKGPEAVRLFVLAVVVAGTGIVTGFLVTDWTAPNSITRLDERITDWFVDTRTDALSSFSTWAAFPADTVPKIIISAIICGIFLWRWRRWDEAVYVALPLVFEALCFITITRAVQRPRPEVDQLIHSTIDSSFPSGHVAAATVYVAVVVVVFRRTTATWARALAIALFVLVAAGVYWARLYQGVHFASDVLTGIILGIVSVVITDRILRRRHHEHELA
jgi:membrane-associated phospholipid phosphatase